MELKLEQFHDEIEGYENEFRASPGAFKTRVFLMALLGYAAIFLFLLINLSCFAALYWWYRSGGPWLLIGIGALTVGFLFYSTVKSLLRQVDLPSGMVLPRREFPYLYDLIDSLRKPLKLGRRKFEVLVDWDYNAYAFSRPAFGFIGPERHYIGFGVPILASLNEEQLKAILAHELAHFSKKHSSFDAWVGRMQATWVELLTRLQNSSITGLPYRAFFSWYVPRLSALTIVLRRENEFEADRIAAEAVGKRAAAQALMRTALRQSLIVDDHWREIYRHALVDDTPVERAVTRLLLRLERESLDRERALEELRWRLGDHTEFYHSHPSLADRLRALDVELPNVKDEPTRIIGEWGLLSPVSTVGRFLNRQKRGATMFLDEVWMVVNELDWKLRHLQSIPLTKLMKQLDREWKEKKRLSVEKAWKRAFITELYYGPEETLPIAKYILKLDETHAYANFLVGESLLRKYDSTGILHLETAIEKDPVSYQETGLAILSDFYQRMGSMHEYREAKYESFAAHEETRKAIQERSRPAGLFDTFLPHDLDGEEIGELVEGFELIPEIKAVYLVRKEVEHLPDSPLYVFGVVPSRKGLREIRSNKAAKGSDFTGQLLFSKHHQFVLLPLSRFLLRRKIGKIDQSLIHRKKRFKKK